MTKRKPAIGDMLFRLETIDFDDMKRIARERGWDGQDDYVRDYCEPEDAADYRAFDTLDKAAAAGRAFLATGKAAYGCVIIDRQVYEAAHDDLGNLCRGCPPSWETDQTFEIAMDGEIIMVES